MSHRSNKTTPLVELMTGVEYEGEQAIHVPAMQDIKTKLVSGNLSNPIIITNEGTPRSYSPLSISCINTPVVAKALTYYSEKYEQLLINIKVRNMARANVFISALGDKVDPSEEGMLNYHSMLIVKFNYLNKSISDTAYRKAIKAYADFLEVRDNIKKSDRHSSKYVILDDTRASGILYLYKDMLFAVDKYSGLIGDPTYADEDKRNLVLHTCVDNHLVKALSKDCRLTLLEYYYSRTVPMKEITGEEAND